MLDIGWSELLIIGVVALIVVGPKDLPHLFHALGRFTARARMMAREFTSAMEDAAKGSGLDDAANSLRDVKSLASKKSLGLDALDRAAETFEKWDPSRPDRRGAKDATAVPDPDAAPPAIPPADTGAAGPEPVDTAPIPSETGGVEKRRLHAVRRSDMKEL